MASKLFPYRGVSKGLECNDGSRTVQSECEGTKIDSILKKFQVTGVLPQVGRVALPADVYFGGEDFNSLQNRLSEARANGLTADDFEEINNDEHVDSNPDSDNREHGSESGVAAPSNGEDGQ